MDPRVKLIAVVLYIVALFNIPTLSRFVSRGGTVQQFMVVAALCYGAIVFLLALTIILSRVPFLKVLRSIRTILFLMLFMTLLTTFFYGGTASPESWRWQWRFLSLSTDSLVNAGVMALRLLLLVIGPTLLTFTTTPVALTDGLESVLSPLKLIKIPVRLLGLIMGLTLSMIPGLIDETHKIMNAQKSRCADFDSGNLFKRAKAMIPILIPLFVQAFKRADDLADAMDSRCFLGAKKRTRMKRMRLHPRDLGLLVFAAALVFILSLRHEWGFIQPLLGVFGI